MGANARVSVAKRDYIRIANDYARKHEGKALTVHHATAKRLHIRRTTLHQHRHSFAVMWIRSGLKGGRDKQWLKNQLGHAPQSTVIDTVYGVYINAARLTEAQAERLQIANGGVK